MRRSPRFAAGIGTAALAMLLAANDGRVRAQATPDEWRTFEGSWSAVVRRQTLPTGGQRPAAAIQLAGAVVLTGSLGAGFQGEAIGFDDGVSLIAGRGVWTDARGDRIFSAFRADLLQGGRRFVGTITGGTGQYQGVSGEYSLTWQYIVSGEDGVSHGRAVDLKGRLRRGTLP